MSAPISAWAATVRIARLTLRRMLRDRSTILVAVLALLPVVFIALLNDRWVPDHAWARVVNVATIPLFAILPPMALAPLIAEEASGQTYSYLWSRPIPRWSVLVGKLVVLMPFVAALFVVSMIASYAIIFDGSREIERLYRVTAALIAGTIACGAVSAAIGVFLRKYAVAASAAYLLAVDLPVGGLPFSVANVSMTHHIREIAGTGSETVSLPGHFLWLAGFTAFATALLLWRLRHIELSASSD